MPVVFYVDPALAKDPDAQTRLTPSRCPTLSIRSASRSGRLPTGPPAQRSGNANLTNARSGDARIETETTMADAHAKHHDYHLVDPSPWPIVGSISAFILAVGAITWMHKMFAAAPLVFAVGVLGVLYTMVGWWRDVIREAEHLGDHTRVVQTASPLRHDPVHRLGGDVLRRLVLGLFQHRAVPGRRASDRARATSSAASGRRRASRPSIPGTCRCSTR